MQFRISTLLWATLVVAASLALAGLWGLLPAAYWIFGLWWAVGPGFKQRSRQSGDDRGKLNRLIVGFMAPLTCCGLLFPAWKAKRERSLWWQCPDRLRSLSLALLDYRDVCGSFPPAVVADTMGRPAHSWRALLLNQLGRTDLAGRYDLSQPWDSSANAPVAATPLSVLQSACDESRVKTPCATDYLAVVGPGTFWSTPAKPGVADTRIVAIEVAESGIAWAEPKDLAAEEFLAAVGRDDESSTVRGPHPGGFYVALVNGRVVWIPTIAPRALVETMLYQGLTPQVERALGELPYGPIPFLKDHDRSDSLRRVVGPLLVWIASVVAFGVHAFRLRRGQPPAPT